MKPEFTEFSFGYALTDNLRRSTFGGFNAAPIFPSLYAEGGAQGGYDVEIPFAGAPLLLQFKVPEVLTRQSHRRPDGFGLPYYRMHIRPYRHSEQHRLLIEHQEQGRLVFYASPRFHTTNDMNIHFINDVIHHHTFFMSPLEIGDFADGDDHCVSYQEALDGAEVRSAPRKLHGHFDSESLQKQFEKAVPKKTSKSATVQKFAEMFETLLTMVQTRHVGKSVGPNVPDMARRGPVQGSAYLARVFFDSELFVVRRT